MKLHSKDVIVAAKSWPARNQTAYNEVKSDLEEMTAHLQALSPETGAYINEVSFSSRLNATRVNLYLFANILYVAGKRA